MPNWCISRLEVTGEDMLKFEEDVHDGNNSLSLEELIPIPNLHFLKYDELKEILDESELKECIFDKNGSLDWYEYSCSKWGTKWDVNVINFNSTEDSLSYTFESAWSPPESWLVTVSQAYNAKFEMTSYEEGCDFWYRIVIENGRVIEIEDMTIRDRLLANLNEDSSFEKVKEKFYKKLSEIEYDEDKKVEEIEELYEIVDYLDCEFGSWQLYNLFDEYREEYYKNKGIII